MKRISSLCIALAIILTLLTACAPKVESQQGEAGILESVANDAPQITPESTEAQPAEEATTAPQNGESSPQLWEQGEVYTAWATRSEDNILGSTTALPEPEGVVKMLPLIEFVLSYRTAYDFYHGQFDMTIPRGDPERNEHNIDDELYTWGLMAHLFCTYGTQHPDVEAFCGDEIRIPERAARDFLSACFGEYGEEWSLPTQAPEGWSKAAVGYGEGGAESAMVFEENGYICSNYDRNPWLTGSVERYVVLNSQQWDDSQYFLHILKIFGPDELDMAGYHVYLSKSDEPDVFGFEWRIARIIKVSEASSTS